MGILKLTYKLIKGAHIRVLLFCHSIFTRFLFRIYEVSYGPGLIVKGLPKVHLAKGAKMSIGHSFRVNSGIHFNRIGRQGPSQFILAQGAQLTIGDQVGMSATVISCKQKVSIGNRVVIGGNVVIYDSDFHSLDPEQRMNADLDEKNTNSAEVRIEDDVFIGAHSTILKGVTIGRGAIIGACSVLSKDVPAGEVWAGNPAKSIRKTSPIKTIKIA